MMPGTAPSPDPAATAAIFAALGSEARVRIPRLWLPAHTKGMVVGDIQRELAMPGSTLSHHLEKLKVCGPAEVGRDRRFLWYRPSLEGGQRLLGFLFAECCRRHPVIPVEEVVEICRQPES